MSKLKKYLKRNKWVYNINAYLKARQIKRRYQRTVKHYGSKSILGTARELLQKRCGNRIESLKKLNQPPNIFYLGTDYFQDRAGILQALSKIGNLNYFTKKNGEYGQYRIDYSNISRIQKLNADRLIEIIKSDLGPDELPDIITGQMVAQRIDGRALSFLKNRYGCMVINIATDDRHRYWGRRNNSEWTGTYGLIPYVDLVATAAPECVEWYLKEGCPAIFFPEASDSAIFHPMPNLPKTHDVSFVGAKYGIRGEIVNALRKSRVKVTTYGNGWKRGRIPTEEVPELFVRSKIVLGVGTIGYCKHFHALKMRDFDGPMSGSLYLTHYNPDLKDLFKIGKEIETYHNIEECVEKVHYYLDHPDEREAIAKTGRLRAEREHTWQKRFKQLLTWLEC